MTLTDAESRALDVGFFALRAASGTRKALTIFKYKSARQTVCRCNHDLFILRSNRTGNVRQMLINLFFGNPHFPGNLPGAHFLID